MRLLFLLLLALNSFAQIPGVVSVSRGSVPTTPNSYELTHFSVHYNTTPFSYLTTASFSDCATLDADAKIVSITTAGTPDANFVTSANYAYADDPANDRILFRDANGKIHVWENDLTEESQITAQVGSTFNQGVCYDPVQQRIYSYTGGTVKVFNLSGTLIETLTAPVVTGDVHWHYDYVNSKFYVARQGADVPIQIWVRSGMTLVLDETLWYQSQGGVAVNNIFDEIDCAHATRTNFHIRTQSKSGLENISISQEFNASGFTVEGLTVAPDGTLFFAEPSGHDDAITNGNRLWRIDNRGVAGQYIRMPSMIRFDWTTGGEVSGQFDTQRVTAETGDKIYLPVFDTNGYTNTENTNAYEYEFSEGGDATISFRGSNTAPTGSSFTSPYGTMPAFNGWGATTPGSEQGTPGNFRYKQAILTVTDATPSTTITLDSLIEVLNPKILSIEHDDGYIYIIRDGTFADQVYLVPNAGTPGNSWTNSTASTRWDKQSGYLNDRSNSAVMNLTDPALISSDQSGYLTVVTRREATNATNVILGVGTSGSSNNRILIRHNSSATAPNSSYTIEQTDGSATVINRVSIADTDTKHKWIEFGSNGSTWTIRIANVNQTLTNDTGSNNGNWFGDLSSPNLAARGFVSGVNGTGRYKFFCYTATMDDTKRALLSAFFTQENMIDP